MHMTSHGTPKLLVLAAGQGTRLRPYTEAKPKCMVEFAARPLIGHLLDVAEACGIEDVVVLHSQNSSDIILPPGQGRLVRVSPGFNMLYNLFEAQHEFTDDIIVTYGDIIYEPRLLRALLASPWEVSVVVDLDWKEYYQARSEAPHEIAESLELAGNRIIRIGDPLAADSLPVGQYFGLMRFQRNGVRTILDVFSELQMANHGRTWRYGRVFERAYMTDFFQELIDRGIEVHAVPVFRGWLEFDTVRDYEMYSQWLRLGTLRRFIRVNEITSSRGIGGNPRITSAGGLVIRKRGSNWETVLVASGDPPVWRIPKGMQEAGERIQETAVREVREETGIFSNIVAYVGETGWTYEYGGRDWDETVHFYLMTPSRIGQAHDDEYDRVEWVELARSADILYFDTERSIARDAIQLVDSLFGLEAAQ